MLLSASDKVRFKILYMDYNHRQLAKIFSTNEIDVRNTARELGIFVRDWDKGIDVKQAKKDIEENTTP
jgi:hypothetical protein